MNLLLAQPDPAVRAQVCALWDGTVDAVGDGFAALERLLAGHYDLCLLDTALPVLPGLKLLEYWYPVDPETRYVLSGESPTFSEARAGMRLHATDFLSPPVDAGELCRLAEETVCASARNPLPIQADPPLLRAFRGLSASMDAQYVRPFYHLVVQRIFRDLPWLQRFVPMERLLDAPGNDLDRQLQALWDRVLSLRPETDHTLLGQALDYTLEHLEENLLQRDVAAHFYLSAPALSALFSEHTDFTYNSYVSGLRLAWAACLLSSPGSRVQQVAEQVGYRDAGYFTRQFRIAYGVSPAEYRQQNTFL